MGFRGFAAETAVSAPKTVQLLRYSASNAKLISCYYAAICVLCTTFPAFCSKQQIVAAILPALEDADRDRVR
eukprot:scaffold90518_cov42-Prasinocladus_malaysianus.AAC.1